MAMVTKLTLTIPVVRASGVDYGAYAIQNTLVKQGWSAVVTPKQAAKKLEVTLQKKGDGSVDGTGAFVRPPFDDLEGAKAVDNAAKALGTIFAAGKDWVVQSIAWAASTTKDLSPGEVGRTAGREIAEQTEAYQAALAKCRAEKGWFCGLTALGIPKWVPPVAIGFGALFLLAQVASIKRAFLGGAR